MPNKQAKTDMANMQSTPSKEFFDKLLKDAFEPAIKKNRQTHELFMESIFERVRNVI